MSGQRRRACVDICQCCWRCLGERESRLAAAVMRCDSPLLKEFDVEFGLGLVSVSVSAVGLGVEKVAWLCDLLNTSGSGELMLSVQTQVGPGDGRWRSCQDGLGPSQVADKMVE